jgi:hypothetical protein
MLWSIQDSSAIFHQLKLSFYKKAVLNDIVDFLIPLIGTEGARGKSAWNGNQQPS